MANRFVSAIRQRFAKCNARFQKKDIVVLMFHEVCSSSEAKDSQLSIDFSNFKAVVESIKAQRRIVRLSDIDQFNIPIAVITFDDTYQNIFNEAVPFLISNDLPFELFVCEELINKPGFISESSIKEMKDVNQCSISFHSKLHAFLSNKNKDDFLNAISSSDFEKKYGIKCRFFAFPYGSFYASYSKYTKEVNTYYQYAFSTINSSFSYGYLKKHKHFLPRVNTCDRTFRKVIKLYGRTSKEA